MKKFNLLLLACLAVLFSCENSNQTETKTTDTTSQLDANIIELSESFDQDDESLNDDMDEAFGSFEARFKDAGARFKGDGSGAEYDSTTGYWTKSHEGTRSRVDSVYKKQDGSEFLVVRNFTIQFNKTKQVRFSDSDGNWIQHPKDNKDAINKIEMNRNGSFDADGTVTAYDENGNVVHESSQKSSHKDKNGSSVLTKLTTGDNLWSLTGSGEKTIEFEVVKGDSTFRSGTKTVSIEMDNLVVKHGNGKKRRVFGKKVRANIISGKITRTVKINDDEIVIATEYFDCETDTEKRHSVRTITKNGTLVKEIIKYCKGNH